MYKDNVHRQREKDSHLRPDLEDYTSIEFTSVTPYL